MPPLLDWLRRVMAGDSRAELEISPEEDELAGLSLTEVLDAHRIWRDRLTSAEGRAVDDFSVSEISRDDLCTLGKWLNGPGRQRYGHLPEYAHACKAHREFHLCAGELLLGRRQGQQGDGLLVLDSRMRDASSHNQLELVRLFAAAHN